MKRVETMKEEKKTFLRLKLNCSVLRAQHEKDVKVFCLRFSRDFQTHYQDDTMLKFFTKRALT